MTLSNIACLWGNVYPIWKQLDHIAKDYLSARQPPCAYLADSLHGNLGVNISVPPSFYSLNSPYENHSSNIYILFQLFAHKVSQGKLQIAPHLLF
jgi:hypothetical protein